MDTTWKIENGKWFEYEIPTLTTPMGIVMTPGGPSGEPPKKITPKTWMLKDCES